jgi:hypothetical protein
VIVKSCIEGNDDSNEDEGVKVSAGVVDESEVMSMQNNVNLGIEVNSDSSLRCKWINDKRRLRSVGRRQSRTMVARKSTFFIVQSEKKFD